MADTSTVGFDLAGRRVTLTLELDPQADGWRATGKNRYESAEYVLSLAPEALCKDVGGVDLLLQRQDGAEFAVRQLTVSTMVPLAGLQKVWSTAKMMVCKFQVDQDFLDGGARSHGSSCDPVLLGLGADGTNACTIGLAWTAPDTFMQCEYPTGAVSDPARMCRFNLTRPGLQGLAIRGRRYHDGIFLSLKPESWYRALGRYAAFVDQWRGFAPRKPSPWTAAPSWHLGGFPSLEQEWVEARLPIARELGFGNLHIDINWTQDPDVDGRVYDGYYEPSAKRFPDFARMVRKIEEHGMILEVHLSNPFIGKQVPIFPQMQSCLMRTADQPDGVRSPWGHLILCPRTQGFYDHLVGSIRHMVRDLGIKSFWHDFSDDAVPQDRVCIADHQHAWDTPGQGWDAVMKGMAEAAWEIDPEVTFVTRRSIANINNKPYLTHACAFDSPYDYTRQRREAIIIRSYSRGLTPFGFPHPWDLGESDEEVARHVASLVFTQVPTICMDLSTLPPGHMSVLRAWLEFYRQHAADLVYGELEPLVFIPPSAAFRVERHRKAFVGCFEVVPGTIPLAGNPDEVYLFNGVCRDFSTRLGGVEGEFTTQWYDHFLQPVGEPVRVAASRGYVRLEADHPVPCLLQLVRAR